MPATARTSPGGTAQANQAARSRRPDPLHLAVRASLISVATLVTASPAHAQWVYPPVPPAGQPMVLDAVVANFNQSQDIWVNDGSGSFTSSILGGGASRDTALGDLDGDGDTDAVVLNPGLGVHEFWVNDGSGSFTVTTVGSGTSLDVALGDINGDDHLDVVVANFDQLGLWANDGSGNFTVTTLVGQSSQGVALGEPGQRRGSRRCGGEHQPAPVHPDQ